MKYRIPLIAFALALLAQIALTPTPIHGASALVHEGTVHYPALSGPFAVGRTVFDWTDKGRLDPYSPNGASPRRLLVTAWYPASIRPGAQASRWIPAAVTAAYASAIGGTPDKLERVQINAHDDAALAEGTAALPILVMSPGDGRVPAFYTHYAEALASQGYVVFGVAHTYNALAVAFPNGDVIVGTQDARGVDTNTDPGVGPLESVIHDYARGSRAVAIQAADIRFVLDRIAALNGDDPRFAGRLDLARIGAFGHSFGGATVVDALLKDERLKAAVNLDGTVFSAVPVSNTRPFMTIVTRESIREAMSDATLALVGLTRADYDRLIDITSHNRQLFERSTKAYFVTIDGATHDNFSDAGVFADEFPNLKADLGTIDPLLALTITDGYLTGFFDEILLGRPPTLPALAARYTQTKVEQKG
jgi:predicted dienelactone hydrolase